MNDLIAKQFTHKVTGEVYVVRDTTTIKMDGNDIPGVIYYKDAYPTETFTRTVDEFLEKFEEVK